MRILMIILAAASLSACATIQTASQNAGEVICKNRVSLGLAYQAMLANSVFVPDPVIQQTIINTANAGLMALEACPPVVPGDS